MSRVTLVSEEQTFPLDVFEKNGRVSIHLGGDPIDVEVGKRSEGGFSVLMNGCSYEAQVTVEDNQVTVELDGERFHFDIEDEDGSSTSKSARRDRPGGMVEVKAPMPGKVVKLLVSAGDSVESGQGILFFEAMKMQNEIRSPLSGVVASLSVKEGQAVEAREVLFAVKSDK